MNKHRPRNSKGQFIKKEEVKENKQEKREVGYTYSYSYSRKNNETPVVKDDYTVLYSDGTTESIDIKNDKKYINLWRRTLKSIE